MKPIPRDIAERYSSVLKSREVPVSLHGDYRKWLQYYLDFRVKYPPPPVRSEHVRLFVQKLRDKKQPPEFLEQAAHAISLFFQSEPDQGPPLQAPPAYQASKINAEIEKKTPPICPSDPTVSPAPVAGPISGALKELIEPDRLTGARYNEWRCLEKTKSPAWDRMIEALAREIKMRHYSRKTLKTYADWCRKIQNSSVTA